MLEWILDGLRLILWGLTSACLSLMDICYDLVMKIASADFLSSSEVWQWYYAIMLFLGVLIVARMLSIFMKFSFDEEFRDKLSISNMLNKLMAIGLVISLLPMILGFVSQVSIWGVNHINLVVGTQASSKPSTFIITSFMNTDNGEFTEDGKWVESGDKVTYNLEDIEDINEEGENDDDYKYFNALSDLFIMVFIGVAAAIMLIINALQIGKRMYAIVMKVLIAPIPISSLIVPGDETFSMWRKMIVSDYCLNYLQTLMIVVVMILSGSKVVQQFGVWIQIISFLSGLLLLLSGIPELARIIGGDTSQASVLQQIASFRLAARGVGHGISSLAGKALGTAGSGAAAIGYGAGRMMGGESIKDFQQASKDSSNNNGFMGGGGVTDGTSSGYSSSSSNSTNNTSKTDAFSTNQQNNSADMDMTTHTNDNASFATGSQTAMGGQQAADGKADPFGPNNGSQSKDTSYAHTSREGTTARQFSDAAQNLSGIKGVSARFVSNTSSHMYQASMNKLQNNRIYKTAGSIHKLGSKRPNEKGGINNGT